MNTLSLFIYAWNGSKWDTPPVVIGSKFTFSNSSWQMLSNLNQAYQQKQVFEKAHPAYHFLVLDGNTRIDSYPPP